MRRLAKVLKSGALLFSTRNGMIVEGSVTGPGLGIGFEGHEIYWHLMYINKIDAQYSQL